jgi:hypothetical protein
MPAHKSAPAQDHTGESLFGFSTVAPEPDGAPARQYDNAGDGLSKVTANSPGWTADAPLRNTGQRKSSKSATYPWTADKPLKNAKKSDGVKPID